MRDQVIPPEPTITNTFFPPNRPTANRRFDLGRSGARIDGQPCYRSEAGIGTATGFVAWP